MSANSSETVAPAVGAEQSTAQGREELDTLLRAESLRSQALAAAVVLGRITRVDGEDGLCVQLAGGAQSRPARLGAALSAEALAAAARAGRPAILAFENGDPTRPIVMGLLQSGEPRTAHGGEPETAAARTGAGAAQGAKDSSARQVDAQVDGRRVRIVAQDEIVLECGRASITLRRNGRVVIRGDYVETHSEGTNRIKGGQVRIN